MAISRTELSRKIADLDNIPTVPALLVPLLKRLGEPAEEVNVTEIVNLISYDKSLTAQCLHMANSPLLGMRSSRRRWVHAWYCVSSGVRNAT